MKLLPACSLLAALFAIGPFAGVLTGQAVTYQPYIQPGDQGPFGPTDQMVVAWQTNESTPRPDLYSVSIMKNENEDDEKSAQFPVNGRVVNNYLAADPATQANPYAFGTDINGARLNDPTPDTVFDPATRTVISPPARGPSALLDKICVRKPELEEDFEAKLSAPTDVASGDQFTYTLAIHNGSEFAVNGVQAVLALPEGVQFLGAVGGFAAINGSEVIVTIARLATSAASTVQITVQVLDSAPKGDQLKARGHVRSSTA